MEYRLIDGDNAEKLEMKVNELLHEGWEPLGAPIVEEKSMEEKGPWFQALTKPTGEISEDGWT